MGKATVKIKDLAPGAVFDTGIEGVKAQIMEHFATGETLLVTAAPIGFRPFTVRPFTFREPSDENAKPNNFAFASLRNDLNNDFLDALVDGGVIPYERISDTAWDLSDHQGGPGYGSVTCKVGMLTEPQVRKYFDAGLLKIEDWEWTITPYAGNANYARSVYTDGSLGYYYAYNGRRGVRPALVVDSDICLSLEPDEVDLSDSVLLREYSSKRLVEEVLRRIAAGEEDTADDDGDEW